MHATIGAFSHLNRILKRANIASLIQGAESAVADAEGVTEHLSEIGKLMSTPFSGSAVSDVSDEQLLQDLENMMAEAGADVVQAPVLVTVAETKAAPVSAAEYMRSLLAAT